LASSGNSNGHLVEQNQAFRIENKTHLFHFHSNLPVATGQICIHVLDVCVITVLTINTQAGKDEKLI